MTKQPASPEQVRRHMNRMCRDFGWPERPSKQPERQEQRTRPARTEPYLTRGEESALERQTAQEPAPHPDAPVHRCGCGASYVAGTENSHRVVFGHSPWVGTPQ